MAFIGIPVGRSSSSTKSPSGRLCVRRARSEPLCKSRTRMSAGQDRDAVMVDGVAERVRTELAKEGVNFDELLNAGRVVSLARKLDEVSAALRSPGLDDAERARLEERERMLERKLAKEKRSVMGSWLKRVFLVQAIVFGAIGGVLANDLGPWDIPVVGQALGFWMVWLFTIPALRARKGIRKFEKSALNIAFLAIPFVNVGLAAVTKECGVIWAADVIVLLGLYVYYGVKSVASGEAGDGEAETETAKIRGVLRYLDWGSWR